MFSSLLRRASASSSSAAASAKPSVLHRSIARAAGHPISSPGAISSSSSSPRSRILSYSVEVVPPANRNPGDEFDASVAALLAHPRVAFVSLGSREPLVYSTHAKRALETYKHMRHAAEADSTRHVNPLVVTVCCRGLGDRVAVNATKGLLDDAGVRAVCVLGGVGPSTPEDLFARPTDLMTHWGNQFEEYVVGGHVGPFQTPEQEAAERDVLRQKCDLGATVVLGRPYLEGEVLQKWMTANAQQVHHAQPVVYANSYIAVARPKLFSKLVARPGAGTLHPMMQKRLAAALLPMHPASLLSEDQWEDNLARIFERDGTQVLSFSASEDLLHVEQERQHVHIVSYGGTSSHYATQLMDGIDKMISLERGVVSS